MYCGLGRDACTFLFEIHRVLTYFNLVLGNNEPSTINKGKNKSTELK